MRKIVQVSCDVCHRLTLDQVVERATGVFFEHHNHADSDETSRALVARARRREGGRSKRVPAANLTSLRLDDPQLVPPWIRPMVECHCARDGRVEVHIEEALQAVTAYRTTGRRQTIRARRPDAR